MQLVRLVWSGLFVAIAACGSTRAMPDAPPAVPDAPPALPDAAQPSASVAPFETVAGASRIAGGPFTMDVEIGHGFDQSPTTGGSVVLDGAATIK